MKNILWINPKSPLPAEDGARLATVDLIRSLISLGDKITLITVCGYDEDPNEEELRKELGVTKVFIVKRDKITLLKRIAFLISKPLLPLTVAPYSTSQVSSKILSVVSSNKWDLVVYDGLHPAAHSTNCGIFTPPTTAKIIYRAHNREADIWQRKAAQTRNKIFSYFLSIQALLMKRFEDSVVKNVFATATVSEEDLQSFKGTTSKSNLVVVPIGLSFDKPLPFPNTKNFLQIMFLGRLDWLPNKQGLIWFLKEVWQEVLQSRKDLILAVAGSGDSKWLQEFNTLPNLKVLRRISSVEELYKYSILSIVPVFYGSGTRVKVIEASKFGRCCLSTQIGVEGIGLEADKTYLRAETSAEWIDKLTNLDLNQCQTVGELAFLFAKENFESLKCAKKFKALYENES